MSETIFDAVKKALAEQMSLDPEIIEPASLIADDLGADSLDAVELIMALEEQFNVTIDGTDAENIKTVDDIVSLVDRLIV